MPRAMPFSRICTNCPCVLTVLIFALTAGERKFEKQTCGIVKDYVPVGLNSTTC